MKQKDLSNLETQNANVKGAQYDKKITTLNFSLREVEKTRTEFQNKLENLHNSMTCKLKLYVTDIQTHSEKTQSDFKQIEGLLASLASASENQSATLVKKQKLQL